MKPVTAIAISGGIDSLTAAFLLKQEGRRIIGIHFLTGYESIGKTPAQVENRIARIADQLAIPIEILDCSGEFKTQVVDYFIRSYRSGLTPNPCLICNPSIKFGTALAYARKLGATRLATGHYARIQRGGDGRCHLHRGLDVQKEQSYFLARLTEAQLAQADFPLGEMTKARVKALARSNRLSPTVRKESQDVCFIKEASYADFLNRHGVPSNPGPIMAIDGQIIGTHQGLHHYTIGQRRGINCPAAHAYYVVNIDPERNCLTVGHHKDLYSDRCRVEGINWIQSPPLEPISVRARVRYRHHAAASTLTPLGQSAAEIVFETPQAALTPGQGAVFYVGDEVLGGGWIAK
jgi:tRNA-specific 2-thiouridylase